MNLGWSEVREGKYLNYDLLYHLETGEMIDVYAGIDREWLQTVQEKYLAPDLKHAILRGEDDYLADLETGTLTRLTELIPEIDLDWTAGTLDWRSGTFILFGNAHTLIVSQHNQREAVANCWAYDLETGVLIQTVTEEDVYPYIYMSNGSNLILKYGLKNEKDGSVTVVDLCTGTRTPVEGFQREEEGRFHVNPDGTKLMYEITQWNEDHTELIGISKLGVLDMEQGTFHMMERTGYEDGQHLRSGWLDSERYILWSGYHQHEERYLYVYDFTYGQTGPAAGRENRAG